MCGGNGLAGFTVLGRWPFGLCSLVCLARFGRLIIACGGRAVLLGSHERGGLGTFSECVDSSVKRQKSGVSGCDVPTKGTIWRFAERFSRRRAALPSRRGSDLSVCGGVVGFQGFANGWPAVRFAKPRRSERPRLSSCARVRARKRPGLRFRGDRHRRGEPARAVSVGAITANRERCKGSDGSARRPCEPCPRGGGPPRATVMRQEIPRPSPPVTLEPEAPSGGAVRSRSA